MKRSSPFVAPSRSHWFFVKRANWLLAGAALFAGCNAGPDYQAPKLDLPANYSALAITNPTTRGSAAAVDLAHWWEALNDPELNSLLKRAAASNLDLQVAITRLQEARTAEAVFAGASLPQMNFSGVAGVGTGTSQTRGGLADGPLNAATYTTGLRQVTHAMGLDTFFEVDLFGNLRRAGQAVAADEAAAEEFRNQVLVTLMADVTRQYVTVRTLQLRLEIANRAAASQQRSADLEHERFNRGIVNELDATLADRELESTLATIAPLRARLLAAERSVAVLLGQNPDTLVAELDRKASLPVPPAAIGSGLPGDLLRRRPDVRQAEAQLVAANARLGVATANLYPKLFLSAAAGEEGQGINRTPVDWRFIWTVGPTVQYPLLDFGLADARVQQQDQATREQLVNYRRTILTAIEQVDNALTGYDADRARLDHLDRAVAAARRAYDLANQRYERGIIDYLNVLDAERELFALQDQRAVSENAAVTDFVDVCQSLGGGWEGFPPPPPLKAPLPAVLATVRDATGNGARPLTR
jgi:NodT family efflux transporter outer membrane factor (OMF) lipoprotein